MAKDEKEQTKGQGSKINYRKFFYKTSIKWQGERKGLLSSPEKPDIQVATPPEFKGHPGMWTPENLFVGAVISCVMTTFLYYKVKENLEIVSYESQAEGTLEVVGTENKFIFSEIRVNPKIIVKQESDIPKVQHLMELTEKECLISNSIKAKVIIAPEIEIIKG